MKWRWWWLSHPHCSCSLFFSSPSLSGTTFPFLRYNFGDNVKGKVVCYLSHEKVFPMLAWNNNRIMRGEWSSVLLYTVSVNGRACSGSEVAMWPKKLLLERRAGAGEIQPVAGRRMWGLGKCSELELCGTLGCPAEPLRCTGVHSMGSIGKEENCVHP